MHSHFYVRTILRDERDQPQYDEIQMFAENNLRKE